MIGAEIFFQAAVPDSTANSVGLLLTNAGLSDRQRYINARGTLRGLLDLSIVPVVNENDAIVTDEIRFGDNDTLAALVANLIEADLLVLLTDQAGLYSADPRVKPDADLIQEAQAGESRLYQMAGPPGSAGRGGMRTKLEAAEKAARSGTSTGPSWSPTTTHGCFGRDRTRST